MQDDQACIHYDGCVEKTHFLNDHNLIIDFHCIMMGNAISLDLNRF